MRSNVTGPCNFWRRWASNVLCGHRSIGAPRWRRPCGASHGCQTAPAPRRWPSCPERWPWPGHPRWAAQCQAQLLMHNRCSARWLATARILSCCNSSMISACGLASAVAVARTQCRGSACAWCSRARPFRRSSGRRSTRRSLTCNVSASSQGCSRRWPRGNLVSHITSSSWTKWRSAAGVACSPLAWRPCAPPMSSRRWTEGSIAAWTALPRTAAGRTTCSVLWMARPGRWWTTFSAWSIRTASESFQPKIRNYSSNS